MPLGHSCGHNLLDTVWIVFPAAWQLLPAQTCGGTTNSDTRQSDCKQDGVLPDMQPDIPQQPVQRTAEKTHRTAVESRKPKAYLLVLGDGLVQISDDVREWLRTARLPEKVGLSYLHPMLKSAGVVALSQMPSCSTQDSMEGPGESADHQDQHLFTCIPLRSLV